MGCTLRLDRWLERVAAKVGVFAERVRAHLMHEATGAIPSQSVVIACTTCSTSTACIRIIVTVIQLRQVVLN